MAVKPFPRESTRVAAEEDAVTFFSFRSLYVGVANCWTCSGVNPLQTPHSFLSTQGSSPTPLSRHCAHLEWESNPAIAWPQVPRHCHGEDIVVDNTVELES